MTHSRAKFMIAAAGLLAVLGLLMIGAWAYRTMLLESLLRDRLSAIGLSVAHVEVAAAGPTGIEVRNLAVADSLALARMEARINWSGVSLPRLTGLSLTGLKLGLSLTPSGVDWRGLAPVMRRDGGDAAKPRRMELADLPAIEIRDASLVVTDARGATVARATVPVFSFVPDAEGQGGGDALAQADVTGSVVLHNLAVGGLGVENGGATIAGRARFGTDGFQYRSHRCDKVSASRLRTGNIVLTGSVSACVRAAGNEAAIAISPAGLVAADVVAQADPSTLDLGIGTLPLIRMETRNGSLAVRMTRQLDDRPIGEIALRGLDVILPARQFAFEGIDFSVGQGDGDVRDDVPSFTFGVASLRHLAPVPALSPLTLRAEARISPSSQVVDVALRQPVSRLTGRVKLDRDPASGEGEVTFDIPLLPFGDGGPTAVQVSPLLAKYVSRVKGGFEATGKISFNDAWATPVKIAGDSHGLSIGLNRSFLTESLGPLSVDFGRSRVTASLPPQAPEKTRISLSVDGGGLRFGSAHVDGLEGDLLIDSLQPLVCQTGQTATGRMGGPVSVADQFVDCLMGAFDRAQSIPKPQQFDAAMAALRRYLVGKVP